MWQVTIYWSTGAEPMVRKLEFSGGFTQEAVARLWYAVWKKEIQKLSWRKL